MQSVELGQMERQQMNFVVTLKRAQLTSGDDTNSEPLAGCPRRGNPFDGVVIGERERGETATLRRFDYALGRKGSVRRGRVGMQVDECRPARIRAHRS